MLHEEILARASEYQERRLSAEETKAVEHHLSECRDCRVLFRRWVVEPPPVSLAVGVMERLPEARWGSPLFRRLSYWGTVAAALLVLTAFYRPERHWMESDVFLSWGPVSGFSTAHGGETPRATGGRLP